MTSARIEVREERVGSKVDNSTDRLRECDSDDKGISFADVICNYSRYPIGPNTSTTRLSLLLEAACAKERQGGRGM